MFTICLTHDVDAYYPNNYIGFISRLIGRRDMNLTRDILSRISPENPFDTFDKIVSMEKDFNATSTFFFLQHANKTDSGYNFEDKPIRNLIQKISKSGFEVSLHGSRFSFTDRTMLLEQKSRLEQVLGKEIYGNRQHFLNLDIPRTFEIEKDIGLCYDATYYPPKFSRKHIFKPFYAIEGVLEIPLAIHERDYYGISVDNIWNRLEKILNEGRIQEGVCTVSFHPHSFYNDKIRFHRTHYPGFNGFTELYQRILMYGEKYAARMCSCKEVYIDWKDVGETWW